MKSIWFYDYPIGKIGIAEENGCITRIVFGNKNCPEDFAVMKTALIDKAASQLDEYFSGKRKEFDLPLRLPGTPFQRSCWAALQSIPWGETRSYKDIAVQIGNPKAVRAVGMANNRNPIPIIVPCHRVIGSDGSLTGYGGGLHVKKCLLDIEKSRG
jgi:methylated-DNA-[protein]-cysteine S-methyltransferase